MVSSLQKGKGDTDEERWGLRLLRGRGSQDLGERAGLGPKKGEGAFQRCRELGVEACLVISG